ncbi:four-carbon acid sugar kinase family protein [Streptomyces sp. NPDC090025]|uniref:four-carbon acid sugar kinase family protein n=1 Tax=Streptomyces sp. NPDC090025 TaxID=3365922 RepID=UPI0038326115
MPPRHSLTTATTSTDTTSTTATTTVAVLADDLTSAADGAAPFRRAGHRALVRFAAPVAGEAGRSDDGPDDGVTAVDLGTRVVDERTAEARTRAAARAYAGAGLLVKTVDSTLRGHVAAELRAALAGSGRRVAIVAPAFPAEGRTTVDGVQYVHGVRVDESAFARDPAHPVGTADLALLLPGAVPFAPGDDPARLAAGGVFVASAVTDADLDALVAAVPRPGEVLWVGSPGLADALARRHPRTPGAAPRPALPAARRPLAVVGSAHPASRRQLAAVRAAGEDDRGTVLHTPDERTEDPGPLLRRLVDESCAAVREGRADGLVLTGGETAAAVLGALGATGIELYDEPEPGIARGTLHTDRGAAPGIPVLVKAGGFGDDATLVRLTRLLRHPGHPRTPLTLEG